MVKHSVIMPFIVPLAAAIASILFRKTSFRDHVSIAGSLSYLFAVAWLSIEVISGGPMSYQAGGWSAPFGISFVADELSIIMLLMTLVVSLAGNLYSAAYIGDRGKRSGYYAFFHFMVAGMSGAFLTGDLFNLFVMFEIILMSSYAMVSYTGTRESLFTSLKYVVLNLIGSSLMLVTIGGLYSITGTLNMADMALILSEGSVNMVPVLGLSGILFCVFAIKSGLVPFHFWAPPIYANSPPPAAAMMAGISKKVGIYAVIRIYLTVLSGASLPAGSIIFAGESVSTALAYPAGIMAAATVLLGGFSAVNRDRFDKMLSYSSVGQVGFIVIPISIAMTTGSKTVLAASLIYILSHSLSKSSLFMVSGIVEKMTGTKNMREMGGLSESSFVLSAAFFISTFSLVGIPPLLGFFGKMLVFRSAIVSENWIFLAVLVFGGLMTLLYFGKAWLRTFFGEPTEVDVSRVSRIEVFSVMILVVSILVLGIWFEPLYQLAEAGAEAALNTENYAEVVLGGSR